MRRTHRWIPLGFTPMVMLALTISCGDETGETSRTDDESTVAEIGEPGGTQETDAGITPNPNSEGLVLRGDFVSARGAGSSGVLELRGTFAQTFASETSSDGHRSLEHLVFGIR